MLRIYSQVDIVPPQQDQEPPEEESRIHWIRESRLPWLDEKIARLNKVAEKLGVAPVGYNVIDEKVESDKDNPNIQWVVKLIEIIGEAPKLQGYSFIARIIHSTEGNLLKAVPGEELPKEYRTIEPHCDHCNYNRRRKDTFVLREDATGRYLQVGSNCLKDFLGHNSPNAYARFAEMLYDLGAEIGNDEDDGFRAGRGEFGIGLESFLNTVYAVIKMYGWASRAKAREEMTSATADIAWNLITSDNKQVREEHEKVLQGLDAGDVQTVKDAIDWARNLKEADDANVDQLSDYHWNLSVAVSSPVVTHKTDGIVASLMIAYDKAVLRGIMPDPSTTAGEKGQEIVVRGTIEDEGVYRNDNSYTLKTEDNKLIRWNGDAIDNAIGSIVNIQGTIVGYSKRFTQVVTNIAHVRFLNDDQFQEKANQLSQTTPLNPEDAPQYVAGEKVTTNVTVMNTKDIDGMYGMSTMFIMIDDYGNNLVYFSNAFDLDKGEKANITATVKDVGEYNGKPSIKITRAKINSRELPEGSDDQRLSPEEEKLIKKQINKLKKNIKSIVDIFGTDQESQVYFDAGRIKEPFKDTLYYGGEKFSELTNGEGARYLAYHPEQIGPIFDQLVLSCNQKIQENILRIQQRIVEERPRIDEAIQKLEAVKSQPNVMTWQISQAESDVKRAEDSIKWKNDQVASEQQRLAGINSLDRDEVIKQSTEVANSVVGKFQQWEENKENLFAMQKELRELEDKMADHKRFVKMYGKIASTNWLTKIASVTFFIDGAQKITQPMDILKICHDFAYWANQNIPHDVFKATYRNIEPDGDDYNKPTGTINIYLGDGDSPEEIKQYMESAVNEYFALLDIEVKVGATETSKAFGVPVIRMHVIRNGTFDLERLPEINMANPNAMNLLQMLGIEPDFAGQINARDLIQRISSARNNISSNTKEPTQDGNFYDFGRSYEQIERYLDELETIAMRAMQMDNPSIVWS